MQRTKNAKFFDLRNKLISRKICELKEEQQHLKLYEIVHDLESRDTKKLQEQKQQLNNDKTFNSNFFEFNDTQDKQTANAQNGQNHSISRNS